MLSCGSDSESSSSDSSLPSTEVTVDDNSPLYVLVGTMYANSTVEDLQGSCYFSSTDSQTSTAKSCSIQIPENQLYYSDLVFTVGTTETSVCATVTFTPYRFQRSNSATFEVDDVATTVDCSASPLDVKCLGGAITILTDLSYDPNVYTGIYFVPTESTYSAQYTLKSSNTMRQTDTDYSYKNNSNATNNLVTRTASLSSLYNGGGSAASVDYLANTMTDYTVECEDKWGNTLYKIEMIIGDDDSTTGTIDDATDSFWDWGA